MDAEGRSPSSLEIRRILPGTPAEVFAAWTDPAAMGRWMSPAGHAEVEVDLRVGGRFRVTMIGEGTTIEHTGEYLEVAPTERLAFTWRSPYTGPEPGLVTVALRPAGNGTELVLTHERLPDDVVEAHRGGWGGMLDRLATEVLAPAEGG